jgi:hypothetical protein
MDKKLTDQYKYCNHHHELTDDYEIVDFGDGEFVANKQAVPLLKALNEVGLRTRTHHIDDTAHAFVGVLLDNVSIEVVDVFERDADRTKYNGKKELRISWNKESQEKDTDNCLWAVKMKWYSEDIPMIVVAKTKNEAMMYAEGLTGYHFKASDATKTTAEWLLANLNKQ